MFKRYSIAEARDQFARLVREGEKTSMVEITRRGKPTAVVISWREYQRLTLKVNFWDRYFAFHQQFDLARLAIEPQISEGVRDQSPGRRVNLIP